MRPLLASGAIGKQLSNGGGNKHSLACT